MAEKLKASLTVNLDTGLDSGAIQQKWEVGRGGCAGSGSNFFTRCYNLYPPEALAGVQVASYGSIAYAGEIGQKTIKEYIKFSNSTTASGKYPVMGGLIVDLQFAFNAEGEKVKNLTFTLNETTHQIEASQPFYGAIHVTYYTRYAIFIYQPEVEVPHGGGYFAQYGNIISFFKNNMADIVVQPPDWADNPVRLELYRVTSNILLNKYGNWETPKNWSDFSNGSKAWPEISDSPIKGGNGAETTRIHEIGYFQEGTAIVQYDKTFIQFESPKNVGGSWSPEYKFEWSQSLDAAKDDQDLMDTLQKINFDIIIDRVKDSYSNLQGVTEFFTGKEV